MQYDLTLIRNSFKFGILIITATLEQLINSLKSEVGGQLSNQTNLSSDHIDKVLSIIGDETNKEVTGQMLGGNLSHLMNLFSDKPNNEEANAMQSNISSGVISRFTSKLDLSPEISKSIADVALPSLINMITKKNNTTPDDDPSPLHELFETGGNSDILGDAKKLLGGFLSK
jgi:hypothetical protein